MNSCTSNANKDFGTPNRDYIIPQENTTMRIPIGAIGIQGDNCLDTQVKCQENKSTMGVDRTG